MLGVILLEKYLDGIIISIYIRGNGEFGKLGFGSDKSVPTPELLECFSDAR